MFFYYLLNDRLHHWFTIGTNGKRFFDIGKNSLRESVKQLRDQIIF